MPVDAATQAPGPGLSPRAALPASRRSHGPQGAPDRHADTLARAPPAAWPARRALPRHALRPHSVGLLGPLPTAGWASRASHRPPRAPHPLGRPPLPMRPAPASAPRQRNLLTAGPSARRGARTGHANALAHAPSAVWPAGRAFPRHAHRPYCVGRSGPPPSTGRSARAAPRPPPAPHPHGAASTSAARRYPRARPRRRPPGHASSLPQVPRPATPASGAPTPLHMRPPRPGLRGAPAPGAPADPMEWGSQGHRCPPAGPPTPPRDRHGPRTRMAPPPPRPPAATHAPVPGLDPPAGRAARPPAHGTQGRAPDNSPYIVPAPSPPLHHLRTGRSPLPCRGGVAAGSKGNRGPAGPRTGGPSIPPPVPPPFRAGAHALPPRRGREPGSHGQVFPLTATRAPSPPDRRRNPPPPLGRCQHTPGQRDAGRLLPRESVSGNFSRRHVLGALTTTTTTTTYHTIPYHTIPYHTIPYHTIPYHIAESPPANPRFFLEGAHEPRGRHRVF